MFVIHRIKLNLVLVYPKVQWPVRQLHHQISVQWGMAIILVEMHILPVWINFVQTKMILIDVVHAVPDWIICVNWQPK